MVTRTAACFCGDYSVTLEGDPMLVSSCCCTRCQRRTGSFFGVTAYFEPAQLVARHGKAATFRRDGGSSTIQVWVLSVPSISPRSSPRKP